MISKPRELKHCFALIHKDAKKYEDWIIMGLPSPTGDDFDCVELREVTHESESELAELRKDYAELLEVKERLAIRLHSELSTLTAKVKRYEEVIEAALRLQDLWLYTGKITVEHASEAQALNLMKRNFEAALNQGED